MKELLIKKFGMSLWIYSEDRYEHLPAALFKHYVEIHVFGIQIFSATWNTGKYSNGQIADGNIYINGQYVTNQYPIKHRPKSIREKFLDLVDNFLNQWYGKIQ